MNTVADTPVPGLAPDSVPPAVAAGAAVVAPDSHQWTWYRLKDILVTIYAFGLLGFGLLFPFLLVAWAVIFEPAGQ
jgi:hypothetical protein